MRITKEQCEEIKAILGQDFIIVIAVPKNIEKRGQKDAGIAQIEMVASIGRDAVEYCLLAAAMQIVENEAIMWEGNG